MSDAMMQQETFARTSKSVLFLPEGCFVSYTSGECAVFEFDDNGHLYELTPTEQDERHLRLACRLTGEIDFFGMPNAESDTVAELSTSSAATTDFGPAPEFHEPPSPSGLRTAPPFGYGIDCPRPHDSLLRGKSCVRPVPNR